MVICGWRWQKTAAVIRRLITNSQQLFGWTLM
jgi:hypothetical protein